MHLVYCIFFKLSLFSFSFFRIRKKSAGFVSCILGQSNWFGGLNQESFYQIKTLRFRYTLDWKLSNVNL